MATALVEINPNGEDETVFRITVPYKPTFSLQPNRKLKSFDKTIYGGHPENFGFQLLLMSKSI